MFECGTCGAEYYYRADCYDHMNQYDHWIECETCNKVFMTQAHCNQHMNAVSHWAKRYPCKTCSDVFLSESAAAAHMNKNGHWGNFCRSCNRQFQSESNFRAHMNSKTHRGTNMKCPFCQTGFVTASGVSHHLETGSCPKAPNMNRHTIAKIVQRLDVNGLIANKQIEWHDSQNLHYEATNQAWNGQSWECYLCHRGYGSVKSLNQHLNSPAHAQKAYHCPNSRGCPKEFATLAALFNHLESESCKFMRFENVQATHKNLTDSIMGNKRITGW